MSCKNVCLIFLLEWFPTIVFATAGMTPLAVPTQIRTANEGFLIYGAFDNPGGCGSPDIVYVKNDTYNYDFVKAMALSAYMGGKRMSFYIIDCYNHENLTIGLVYPYRNIVITD